MATTPLIRPKSRSDLVDQMEGNVYSNIKSIASSLLHIHMILNGKNYYFLNKKILLLFLKLYLNV
ncbi:hypothetical protein V6Z11_A07G211200 [Gossypium hirsutum]